MNNYHHVSFRLITGYLLLSLSGWYALDALLPTDLKKTIINIVIGILSIAAGSYILFLSRKNHF